MTDPPRGASVAARHLDRCGPVVAVEPPRYSDFSATSTRRPSSPAATAASRPVPEPTTTTSKASGESASRIAHAPSGNVSRRSVLYPPGYAGQHDNLRSEMSTIALTEDTFEETVTKPGITLVDWWSSWCGPCRMFAPVFQAASEKHEDITFGKIDTEDQPGLSAAARITSIPTLMAFRDGILVFSQPGALPAASLEKLIQAVRDLDMDQVRAELAQQQGASR